MSNVDHPQHYNQVPGIECIDVVERFNFNRGNSIKYIWRAGYKGNVIEDLLKANWYIVREIDRLNQLLNDEICPVCETKLTSTQWDYYCSECNSKYEFDEELGQTVYTGQAESINGNKEINTKPNNMEFTHFRKAESTPNYTMSGSNYYEKHYCGKCNKELDSIDEICTCEPSTISIG